MLLNDNPKNLYEKLELAKKQLKNAKSKAEKIALSSYICNLYDLIRLTSSEFVSPGFKSIYGTRKNIYMCEKKIDEYEAKMTKDYVAMKDFHNTFFGELYRKIGQARRKIVEDEYAPETELSEDDVYNILYEFMNKIGQAKYFDKYVRDGRIYSIKVPKKDTSLGSTVFNPITKDSDVFLVDIDNKPFFMKTLAHEFGHVYDLNHFDDELKKFNKYFYQSFNAEAVSKTFERLFIDFLLENNILYDEAKDLLFDIHNENFECLMTAYIISLIPDVYLMDGSYLDLKKKKIYKLVERHFTRKNKIDKFINKRENFEIGDKYRYAYGDIYSLILKQMIKDNDYKLDCLEEFFSFRSESFSPDMLDRLGITTDKYVKLYKKDIELLKKQSD